MTEKLTLGNLGQQAIDELQDYLKHNPQASEEDVRNWMWEVADYSTPIHNRGILLMAANNLAVIGLRDVENYGQVSITPVKVAQLAIFDYLLDILYDTWHTYEREGE